MPSAVEPKTSEISRFESGDPFQMTHKATTRSSGSDRAIGLGGSDSGQARSSDPLQERLKIFDSSISYWRCLIVTGWIGILASLIVGGGEFLVHYAGEALHDGVPYRFFESVPAGRLPLGHFLMVAGLPLYPIGYVHLFLALLPGSRRLATTVLVLGAASFMIGGVWAGSRGFLGTMVLDLTRASEPAALALLLEQYDFLIERLVQVLRVLVLANSAVFVFTIVRRPTLYPRWMAWFNPIGLLVLVFLLFLYLPVVGNFLVPTAMNVAHFMMFNASLWAVSRRQGL